MATHISPSDAVPAVFQGEFAQPMYDGIKEFLTKNGVPIKNARGEDDFLRKIAFEMLCGQHQCDLDPTIKVTPDMLSVTFRACNDQQDFFEYEIKKEVEESEWRLGSFLYSLPWELLRPTYSPLTSEQFVIGALSHGVAALFASLPPNAFKPRRSHHTARIWSD